MTTTRQRTTRGRRPPRREDGPAPRSNRGRRPDSSRARTGNSPARRKVLRRRWVAVLSVLTVAGVAYVLLFTSMFGVRSVEVSGAETVSAEAIRSVAKVPEQRAMLRVDTDAIRDRVATLPAVATVVVARSWPSTIEITVTERSPIGFYDTGESLHLVDGGGVVYKEVAEPPKGLPELRLARVGPDDPATRAVTAVLGTLPHELRERVTSAGAQTAHGVEFTLDSGKSVRWGDVGQSERKAKVLGVLLTRKGQTYDVSSPELPTVS
ncbi:cell division protein FtsQ/DivIB [Qaidamihabitans albus]|uniref:cell division protein FtsQ/DivIB n=1 Tax=Qaidamihabitans albus TaxID=2795733 RepID=UPI0018F258AC|nr:FtsQ-type POTRA domain-containing protein [Qaidamihabitans albus]